MNAVTGPTNIVEKGIPMLNEVQIADEATRKDLGLTQVEKKLLALTAYGYSSKEMAQRIGLSNHALRLYLTSICAKAQVSNRLELALFALNYRLNNSHATSPPHNWKGSRLAASSFHRLEVYGARVTTAVFTT
jgi:DNA-binding CsgD family transcriptional regulator